jgi:hypothetical protein
MHSASAKKRKKSGKRSRCKEDSGSRVRSRDRVENKTVECNSAINTYPTSIMRKDQSPVSLFNQDRTSFDDDEHLLQHMQDSIMLSNHLINIEKSLKKQVKIIDSQKSKSISSQDEESTKFNTEIEESKVNLFIKSLGDISNLHPSTCQLFSTIKEGVEDCLNRLVSREKFKNICLQDSWNKSKKELTKEQVEREALECQYFEMQERVQVMKKLDLEHQKLEAQLSQLENEDK